MTRQDPPAFDPEGLLSVLTKNHVDFVLIGAFGAVLHGSPMPTQDVDICPKRDTDNLGRLAAILLVDLLALWEATGSPFASTLEEAEARLKSESILSFQTRLGHLDVVFEPAGTAGYKDLVRHAVTYKIGRSTVQTSSLADIIRSKEAAHRERDLQQLPTLRKLLERKRDR
ncbi:MAG: hypothetical protein ABR579_11655 [Actinomycetota bacterium]